MQKSTYFKWLRWFLALAAFFWLLSELAGFNYLLFHTLSELVAISTILAIFMIAVNTRKLVQTDTFLILGYGLFISSVLQLLHVLTYKGVGIFPEINPNVPTQLWIAFRFIQALAVLAGSFFIARSLPRIFRYGYLAGLPIMVVLIIWSIFVRKNFPDAFVEGTGLTQFKIIGEYVISGVFALTAWNTYRNRHFYDASVSWNLHTALVLSILAGLSFTQYVSVYGFFNMLGHAFLILSFFFFYEALVSNTLRNPFQGLFRELNEANLKLTLLASKDPLTGLDNRRSAMEKIKQQFQIARRMRKKFSIIMVDLNYLKSINDRHGHLAGDEALKRVAESLTESLRQIDIVGRYGGDEFIICPLEADSAACEKMVGDFLQKLESARMAYPIRLTATAGICEDDGQMELLDVITSADSRLVGNKQKRKALDETPVR